MVYLDRKGVLSSLCVLCALAAFALADPARAQSLSSLLPQKLTLCKVPDVAELSVRSRACYYTDRVLAPSGLGRAIFASGFQQFRDIPKVTQDGFADFAHRFGVYYARRTAQNLGEFAGGYLGHEDPRYRLSHKSGFWNRTGSALRSAAWQNGHPALAPIAGSFGSGFVGVACYRTHNSVEDGFSRTGISYGGYFGTAVFKEFEPELTGFANRLLHSHK